MRTSPVPSSSPSSTTSAQREVVATSSATGWLTYRNEREGFSFQYPPTFKVSAESSDTIVYAASAANPSDENLDFSSLVTRTSEATTSYAFAHGGLPSDYKGFAYDRETIINGITVYEYGLLHGAGTFAHSFFLEDQYHGIDATYEWTSPLAKEFESILRTFRFTGP
jgi:hypothetical protein